jgi:hypothetical protein
MAECYQWHRYISLFSSDTFRGSFWFNNGVHFLLDSRFDERHPADT